jgi:branched-chain amino acid transport system substrate-binding protein
MRTRGLRALVLGVVLAATFAACGDDGDSVPAGAGGESGGGKAAGVKGDKIMFGLITSASGPAAPFGLAEKASVEVAADTINAAGGIEVDGKKYEVEVKTYDSADEPTKGVTAAQQAVNKDGVRFIEVFGGHILPAMQSVAEEADAMIFGMAIDNNFLGPDHPYTYGMYLDLVDTTLTNVKYLQQNIDSEEPRLVLLHADDEIGQEVGPKAKEETGKLGFTVDLHFVAADATDFAGLLGNILEDDPDIIDFGNMNPAQYAVFVKQARQLGFEGDFSFPNVLELETVIDAAGKDAAVGSVGSPDWATDTTEKGKQWAVDLEGKTGGDPAQTWTAISHDNVLLWKAAIEQANSLDPEKIAAAFQEVTIDGVLGEGIGYDEAHNLDSGYRVLEIQADGTTKPVATAGE